MSTKYVFIVGGVISGCGKGVTATSIGLLLKFRGYSVEYLKLDPYLNVDSGTLNPGSHGELFVLDDGTETDLDLGWAERILGINASKRNIATSGSLYKTLIEEQENGKYLGSTIQVIPHLTNLIQQKILDFKDCNIVIIEIGGTIGDIESDPYYSATRQFKQKYQNDVLVAMVAPILWIQTIKEFKTKPLQNSVRELQRYGIHPDILFCRVNKEVPDTIIGKISNLTGIKKSNIFQAPDVTSIYQVPIEFYERHVDDLFVDLFRLNRSACRIYKYREIVEKYVNNNFPGLDIGIVGKYDTQDAYLSLKEALIHAGISNDVKINIHWIKAETVKDSDFIGLHGVIVPGGFDYRGVEGKIQAIKYVRENKIPFLGICLGLQCAVIEAMRNIELEKANSEEFDKNCEHKVIHFLPGQKELKKKSATMRLGNHPCELEKDSIAYELYKKKTINERHRHRYEVNSEYLEQFTKANLRVSGKYLEGNLIEILELDRKIHPFFIGCQYHPEFKSRLMSPHPLFIGFISAALNYKVNQQEQVKSAV